MKFLRSARRLAVAALATATATLSLTGCGESDDEPDEAGSATTSAGTPSEEPTATEPSTVEPADPAGPQVFESTVAPAEGAEAGRVVTAIATDASPSTAYLCVLSVITADGSLTASNVATVTVVTSDANGNLECEQTFEPFEAADENGDTRSCPPTESDAEAGFSCAVALADQTTVGATSASVGYFTPAGS